MPSDPASPPCFAHELVLGAAGFEAVDAETARDVARWRRAERARLIAARLAVGPEARAAHAAELARELDALIDLGARPVVSLYWPFRGEPDLRPWMARAHAAGARIALPVVVAKGQPLVFREWRPGAAMARGVWNIPVPAEGPELIPQITIAPLVGTDPGCYRLGYGGGFYDRTLAALAPRPLAIGVALPLVELPTIFPQPHDIPMDIIVTGAGRSRRREG
jgi:5,10-methenyltetrahydrofolate synthetase